MREDHKQNSSLEDPRSSVNLADLSLHQAQVLLEVLQVDSPDQHHPGAGQEVTRPEMTIGASPRTVQENEKATHEQLLFS